MRILFLGDIFGRPGRRAVVSRLMRIKAEYKADFCIANGENAAGGKGLTFDSAKEIYASGVDVITLGNHTWDNKDIFSFIDGNSRLVRAYNYPPGLPGQGYTALPAPNGKKVIVAQILCRLFMSSVDCPFRRVDDMLREIDGNYPIILDLHGEATSEKVAMGWYLDGRVTAVVGTHTHIPTADERILPNGTAYISDVGMSGPYDSVIGMEIGPATKKFLSPARQPHKVAKNNVKICAVLIDVDDTSNKALSIKRISVDAPEVSNE